MTNPAPVTPLPLPPDDAPRGTSPDTAPWRAPDASAPAAGAPASPAPAVDAPGSAGQAASGAADAGSLDGHSPAPDADKPATGTGGTTPAGDADKPTGNATANSAAPADGKPAAGSSGAPAADAGGKPSRAAQLARQYAKPVPGVKGLVRGQPTAAVRIADAASGVLAKNAGEGVKTAAKWGARALPFVGSVLAVGMAVDDFRDGDYVGGTLNAIGAIPGPVGWVGMGAGALWNAFFDESIGMWDAPNGTTTFMLPGAAAEFDGVKEVDAKLTAAQRELYAYADGPTGSVWNSSPPDALKLNTEPVAAAARAWLDGLTNLFTNVESTLTSSGEPYFADAAAKLAPHLKTMAEMAPACTALLTQLQEVDAASSNAYQSVLDANQSVRMQLSENGELSDAGPASTLTSALQTAQSAITAANSRIGDVFPAAPPTLLPSAGAPAPQTLAAAPGPATPAPAVPVAPGAGGAGVRPADTEKKPDDLSKLLSGLGKQNPLGGNPLGGGGNPLGGAGGGSPLGGGNPMGQGRKLDNGEGRKLDDKSERKLDDKERKPLEEKAERKLSTATPANATTAAPPAATAPAAAGTPVVKGEAAKAGEPKPNTEVAVKGERVDFKDPKLAKLAQLLANATPQQPMSLADAAAASGLTPPVPGQDPGQQVPPASAKAGDVLVVGDKQFMLLGEGRFYDLQTYSTVGASELPPDAGSRGGYFHLNDPADPSAAGGGGAPVSPPPAAGVPFDVPGGQPPAQTVDASPAAAGGAPDPVDNPEAGAQQPSTPPAGPTGGGIPSAGSPGVPAAGGAGPSNAAGTATGVGIPTPSMNAAPLDPSAVK